jgi:serine/threonine protein kinase
MANSPAVAVVDVGTVIDGTYIIEGLLGRGGMGTVFLASHNRLAGKQVAIKMLHVDTSSDEILKRFKTEAEIAAKLDHPNIVVVIDYKTLDDGTPYIVYEYLQGESLAQRLAEEGALDLESVFSIIRQVGSALTAAHGAGVVHRDLKPANIFLVPSEADGHAVEVAKVLDFGISKITDDSASAVRTQESTLLGTPQYMSPEQANGQHSIVDARTDIFALGEILYELVSGVPAFTGSSIPEVVHRVVYEPPKPLAEAAPDVPAAVVAVIMKALEKKPEDRYQSVNELVEALTGSPLSLVRKPRASRGGSGAAPPSSRNAADSNNSSRDAFARTVASGEHGASPTAATLAPVSPSTPTVRAQPGAPIAIVQPELPSTVAPAPRTAKRHGALLAAAGATLVGAALLWFGLRGGHETPTPIPMPPRTPVLTEPELATPTPAVAPADAAAVRVAEAPRPATPPTATPKLLNDTPARPAEAHEAGEPDVEPLVVEAEAAIGKRDWDQVERIANRIGGYLTASKLQAAKGRMYHGISRCSDKHNDDEQARVDLRAITELHAAAQRARLLKFCKSEHHLEADQ